MNWWRNYSIILLVSLCKIKFTITNFNRRQKVNILMILLVPCFLLVSGCTSSKKDPSSAELKPKIGVITPSRIDQTDSSVTLTLKGSGFHNGSIVRVVSSDNNNYIDELKPLSIKSNQLLVRIDSNWLKGLTKIEKATTSLFSKVSEGTFNVQIINPGGQKSNLMNVYTQNFSAQIKQMSIQKSITISPGSRGEVAISVERGKWQGDIPLRVIGASLRKSDTKIGIRTRTLKVAKQMSGITGQVIIPAGKSSAKLALDIGSDVQPGKYTVVLGLPIDGPVLTSNDYSIYNPGFLERTIDVEIYEEGHQLLNWLPLPPEIVEFQRTTEGYIQIIFKDNSNNESGFRIYSYGQSPTLVGTVGASATPSIAYLDFVDTGIEPGHQSGYIVAAWNGEGESASPGLWASPPDSLPSDLQVFFREDDFLLDWMDNSADTNHHMTIQRQETLPGVPTWESVRELSFLSSQGIGPMSKTDHTAERNRKYKYRIRDGDSMDAAYSEVVTVWFREGLSPAVPSNFWANGVVSDDTKCILEWTDNATNEDGYKIERKIDDESWVTINRLDAKPGTGRHIQSVSLRGESGTVNYFRVIAYNEYGASLDSASISIQEPSPPEAPVDVRLETVLANSIRVRWEDRSHNESGFKVERKQAGGNWQEVHQQGSNSEEWTNTGLLFNTEYCYRVRAYNDAGSNCSDEVFKRTLPEPGPELVFDSFYIFPTTLDAGPNTPFRMYYSVCNMGDMETGDFKDRLFFPDRNGQIKEENKSHNSIPPYGCYEAWKDFPNGLPAGTYQFGVELDVDNDVAEQSEQPGYIWVPGETPYNPTNGAFLQSSWW